MEESREEEDSRQEKLEDEELPEPHPGASSLKFVTSVVAIYEGQWFLADVVESQEKGGHGYTRLSYAAIKGTNCFTWTDKPDIMVTLNEDILSEVNVVPLNNRGDVGLTKQDFKKVENWMIVVYMPFILNIFAQYSYFIRKRFSKLKLYFPQFFSLLFYIFIIAEPAFDLDMIVKFEFLFHFIPHDCQTLFIPASLLDYLQPGCRMLLESGWWPNIFLKLVTLGRRTRVNVW